MINNFKEEFVLDTNIIYLNSGSHSICPKMVTDALINYQMQDERNPTTGLFLAWERLWAVQKKVAKFLGASPADMFLRPNVTTVLNTFILGLPLSKDSEILFTDLEYGAIVNTCRFKADRDGIKLRTLVLPTRKEIYCHLNKESLVQQIISHLRPETKMLLISHIMTANGLIIPIKELARETRKRGIFLVVDGAHGPGAVPLNFLELEDVDFYAGNFHKWFMGPKGTAFGWVAKRHQKILNILEPGWTTYDVPSVYQTFGAGSVFQTKFMISSSHNFAPYYALSETVDFWDKFTPEKIFERLNYLTQFTVKTFEEKVRWPLLSPPTGELLGPLITFESTEKFSELKYNWMLRLLKIYGLQVATPPVRGRNALRISPHIYNTEEDILRCAEIIKEEIDKF